MRIFTNVYKGVMEKSNLRIVIMSRKRVRNKQSVQLVLCYNCVNAQNWKLYELNGGIARLQNEVRNH